MSDERGTARRDGFDFPCPARRTTQGESDNGFVGSVDDSLNHPVLREDPPPKCLNVGYPTRINQTSALGRRSRNPLAAERAVSATV